jgi:hypothetical protein
MAGFCAVRGVSRKIRIKTIKDDMSIILLPQIYDWLLVELFVIYLRHQVHFGHLTLSHKWLSS